MNKLVAFNLEVSQLSQSMLDTMQYMEEVTAATADRLGAEALMEEGTATEDGPGAQASSSGDLVATATCFEGRLRSVSGGVIAVARAEKEVI